PALAGKETRLKPGLQPRRSRMDCIAPASFARARGKGPLEPDSGEERAADYFSSASTRTILVSVRSPTCSRTVYSPGGTRSPPSAGRIFQTTVFNPAFGEPFTFVNVLPPFSTMVTLTACAAASRR